jgi:hypothetical protein
MMRVKILHLALLVIHHHIIIEKKEFAKVGQEKEHLDQEKYEKREEIIQSQEEINLVLVVGLEGDMTKKETNRDVINGDPTDMTI